MALEPFKFLWLGNFGTRDDISHLRVIEKSKCPIFTANVKTFKVPWVPCKTEDWIVEGDMILH